jgi:hypothetical protein
MGDWQKEMDEIIELEGYHDADGNPISLDTLCRKEPAWAANVIRMHKAEVERSRALKKKVATALRDEHERYERFAKLYHAALDRLEQISEPIHRSKYEWANIIIKEVDENQ